MKLGHYAVYDVAVTNAINAMYQSPHVDLDEPEEKTVHDLRSENKRLRSLLDEAGIQDVDCSCGSGAHPRECGRHPWARDFHVLQLELERAQAYAEDMEVIAFKLEKK